ncbi:hypothetical protein BT67DRAFT_494555 [Trichocladium antarcticum]|uniref:Uncharacterized protein n=1 Tax=Trichocladium antarcticum TaxID=1450529 RepID=A0AAN6UM83_9PEZI|nr:hypothetical protein BT67DRAFT_494555 [Trichocladium antarcticum]
MESPDPPSAVASGEPGNTSTAGSAPVARTDQLETKRQRLQDLRAAHECVGTIMDHMEKHYKTVKPPPWLDLRVIAGQLERSILKGAHNATWKSLRDSLINIHAWMAGHRSWKEAVQVKKMPYIGTRSDIMAVEFFNRKNAALPRSLMSRLVVVRLEFLVEWEPRASDQLAEFWKDAEVDNVRWRQQYMSEQETFFHVPFTDDLTDLVLSTVCENADPRAHGDQRPPKEGGISNDAAKPNKGMKAEPSDDMWEGQVQIAMSRIAATVNETLAAEKSRLLKRFRSEDSTADDGSKRHKTAEDIIHPEKPIDTVASDDDHPSADLMANTAPPKGDDRYRALKASNKKLHIKQDKLVALYNKLEDENKMLKDKIEQMAAQREDLPGDGDGGRENKQQEVENGGPDIPMESVEDDNQAVQALATLGARSPDNISNNVRFEEQLRQKDENDGLREKMLLMMARIEVLEQARATQVAAEGSRTAASLETDGAKPASTIKDNSSESTAAASSPFAPQAQSSRAVQNQRRLPATEQNPNNWPQFPASPSTERHQPRRALSQFPRVLDMPTFDSPPPRHHSQHPEPRAFPAPPHTTTAATAPAPAPTKLADHPYIRRNLPWLPPQSRDDLVAFMVGLDTRIWRHGIQEIVAHCEASGLQYERVTELVVGFRRVLKELGMEGL